MTGRPAAFLDRDGTIIEDTGFVRRPEGVRLIPGSAEAIRRLNQAGWATVVVTNQSGIARGVLTEADYRAVAARMEELLFAAGARIDATYMCPHHPEVTGPCECRKPALANYRRAIEELGLDSSRSIFVGDRLTDLVPAGSLGGRAFLVLTGEGARARPAVEARGASVVANLNEAVRTALAWHGAGER